jgi:CelD/BcsL family acetyltransferase involved in cellulose biosynthesis
MASKISRSRTEHKRQEAANEKFYAELAKAKAVIQTTESDDARRAAYRALYTQHANLCEDCTMAEVEGEERCDEGEQLHDRAVTA